MPVALLIEESMPLIPNRRISVERDAQTKLNSWGGISTVLHGFSPGLPSVLLIDAERINTREEHRGKGSLYIPRRSGTYTFISTAKLRTCTEPLNLCA
jgi:hypothetical protein